MRTNLSISLMAAAALILGAGQAAAIDQWPETGATTCYNNAGTPIACDGSAGYPGQDGSHTGFARSYTDNADGTFTDNVTGLMWAKGSIHNQDQATAISACDLLTSGTHTDWRLPTIKELATLANLGTSLPAASAVPGVTTLYCTVDPISPGTCTSTDPTGYWSSTDRVTAPTEAWAVNFNIGTVGFPLIITIDKTTTTYMYARCVRDAN